MIVAIVDIISAFIMCVLFDFTVITPKEIIFCIISKFNLEIFK